MWIDHGATYDVQDFDVPDPNKTILELDGCKIFRYDKESVTYHRCRRHNWVIAKWYGDVQEGDENGQSTADA